mgnify:CR=1 FL=1
MEWNKSLMTDLGLMKMVQDIMLINMEQQLQ